MMFDFRVTEKLRIMQLLLLENDTMIGSQDPGHKLIVCIQEMSALRSECTHAQCHVRLTRLLCKLDTVISQ